MLKICPQSRASAIALVKRAAHYRRAVADIAGAIVRDAASVFSRARGLPARWLVLTGVLFALTPVGYRRRLREGGA